ncbi:hypothetical protein N9174_00315 [bacterium]|nr:hypothetical protein [bacterium]
MAKKKRHHHEPALLKMIPFISQHVAISQDVNSIYGEKLGLAAASLLMDGCVVYFVA